MNFVLLIINLSFYPFTITSPPSGRRFEFFGSHNTPYVSWGAPVRVPPLYLVVKLHCPPGPDYQHNHRNNQKRTNTNDSPQQYRWNWGRYYYRCRCWLCHRCRWYW